MGHFVMANLSTLIRICQQDWRRQSPGGAFMGFALVKGNSIFYDTASKRVKVWGWEVQKNPNGGFRLVKAY